MSTKANIFSASILSALLAGCGDMCANEVSQTLISPSGRYVAYVFSRNCGATTGFNTQVSVLPTTHKPPQESGNTFISGRQVPLVLQWQGDESLKITGASSVSPTKQVAIAEGIKAIYVPTAP
jgi:hypothetical protein